jgi:hypothetical protein
LLEEEEGRGHEPGDFGGGMEGPGLAEEFGGVVGPTGEGSPGLLANAEGGEADGAGGGEIGAAAGAFGGRIAGQGASAGGALVEEGGHCYWDSA